MPVVDTTQSFATGDTVTSTTLNDIMDNSVFVAGAVVSGSGLAITTGGQMTTSNIPGANITNLSISGGKITDNTLSAAKLENPSFIWSSASNIGAIELGTNITTNASSYIDFHSVHPLTDYETRIIREPGSNGLFAISNTGAGAISLQSSGGVTFASANMPNPVGNAPIFGCRAFVQFEGRSTNGNCTIRASGNVTSVFRTAAGKYTVNFGTPMQNVYYAVTCSASSSNVARIACADRATATLSSIEIETYTSAGAADDFIENSVMVIQ